MRKLFASLVVFLFVSNVFVFSPAHADTEGVEVIGQYEDVFFGGDLTEKHLVEQDDGFILKAPKFAKNLAVDLDYLDREVTNWGADHQFEVKGGRAIFPGKNILIAPFAPSEEPVFTWGSAASVQLLERPMWIAATSNGSEVTISMEDGDTEGQSIFIAKSWLWEQGMHKPHVVHEDGSVLPVVPDPDRGGFIIDIHHFSFITLTSEVIDVTGEQDGVTFPHVGMKRWYEDEQRLEIDVATYTSEYVLYVEKDWVDLHIPDPALLKYRWEVMLVDETFYYGVTILPDQPPDTVVFLPFAVDRDSQFSHGSYQSVRFATATEIAVDGSEGNLTVYHQGAAEGSHSSSVEFNLTYLESLNLTEFAAHDGVSDVGEWGYRGDSVHFALNTTSNLVGIRGAQAENAFSPRAITRTILETLSLENLCQDALGQTDIVFLKRWSADTTGGGSQAELYVHKKMFCFAWDLVEPSGTTTPVFMASYGITASDGTNCGYGTTSSKNKVSRKEAAVCDMKHMDNLPAVSAGFLAAYVDDAKMPWYHRGETFQSGMACAGSVVAAGVATAAIPVFVVIAVSNCGRFFWELGKAVEFSNRDVGAQLITREWESIGIAGVLGYSIYDPGERRLTTWKMVEEQPSFPRSDPYDGWQSVAWTVINMDTAIAYYEPDVSELKIWNYEEAKVVITDEPSSDSNVLAWEKVTHLHTLGTTKIEMKHSSLHGIDWETPESDSTCVMVREVVSTVDQVDWRITLGAPGGGVLSCQKIGISPPPLRITKDWIQYEVESTNIPSDDLRSSSGWISLQDVENASFDIPLALAQAVTSNESFLSGIHTVKIGVPDGSVLNSEDACTEWEWPHNGMFMGETMGEALTTGEHEADLATIRETVCFDPLALPVNAVDYIPEVFDAE